MATALTEKGRKEDTQAGTALFTEREEKYVAPEKMREGPTFTLRVKEQAPHHDDDVDYDGTDVHIFLCPATVAGHLYVKEEQLPCRT